MAASSTGPTGSASAAATDPADMRALLTAIATALVALGNFLPSMRYHADQIQRAIDSLYPPPPAPTGPTGTTGATGA